MQFDALTHSCVILCSWFLFMTFLILPSVSTKIFSTFACRAFDEGYGSYLKVDYSIDCDGAEHKLFQIYALACVAIFPMGIPLMYWMLLRRVKEVRECKLRSNELRKPVNGTLTSSRYFLQKRGFSLTRRLLHHKHLLLCSSLAASCSCLTRARKPW